MKTIGIVDAENHLSELIDSREAVTITKDGRPVALLSPIRENPAEVADRILASRCIDATSEEILAMVRGGRPSFYR